MPGANPDLASPPTVSVRLVRRKWSCSNMHDDDHWSKKSLFLCVQTSWVCPSGTQGFCKDVSDSTLEPLTVTRFESLCEKCDSKESSYHFSQRDSSRVWGTKNRDSSRVIDSSHAITVICCKLLRFIHAGKTILKH